MYCLLQFNLHIIKQCYIIVIFLFSEVKVLTKCGHPKKTINELAFPEPLPDNATEHEKKNLLFQDEAETGIYQNKNVPGGHGT